MSEFLGEHDPRAMPRHLFFGALDLHFDTALKANIARQNFTVCPRYWYVDATFTCSRCGKEYCFSADEQRFWYEERHFWIGSSPKHCPACRQELRKVKSRRQEYDRDIAVALQSAEIAVKRRLVDVIDELYEVGEDLPDKVHLNRQALAQQIAKMRRSFD